MNTLKKGALSRGRHDMKRGPYHSGKLRRREDGRYYFDVRVGGRRYQRVLGTDKLVAQRALAKLLHEKGEAAVAKRYGLAPAEERDPATFSEVADDFVNRGCRGDRGERRLRQLVDHLKRSLGTVRFTELQPSHVLDYKTTRQGETYSNGGAHETPYTLATINRELAALKKLFTWRRDMGLSIPFENRAIKMFPAKRAEKKRQRILEPEEEVRLMAAVADHLRPIVQTALGTGMRLGEILGLRWSVVHLRKGKSNIVLEDGETKSGEGRRIPLGDETEELLTVLKAQRGESEFVFVNPETGRPWTTIKTGWTAARRRAAIKGLRFHDLRHTYATRLSESGQVDLVTLQHILGHASILMTARYVTPYPKNINERITRALAGGPEKLDGKAEGRSERVPATSAETVTYN
jgi:integrase